jgi:hypothetical protein
MNDFLLGLGTGFGGLVIAQEVKEPNLRDGVYRDIWLLVAGGVLYELMQIFMRQLHA